MEPHRADGGSRLYSQHDVARLTLIKRLVDSGHAIGTVANLDLEQLEERVASAQQATTGRAAGVKGPVALVVVGSTLPVRLKTELDTMVDETLHLAGAYVSFTDFERVAESLDIDVLAVELPTLNEESVAKVRRLQRLCGAKRLVVVYGFARKQHLGQMEDQGIRMLRFPVTWAELRRACNLDPQAMQSKPEAGDFESALGTPAPARLLSDGQLARASAISTTIKCECPHHLADLILAMSRFEQYSEECENRTREDAALHAYLHQTTARARLMLEETLVKLIEVEGLDIDAPAVE